jgi:hypothetical protein
MDRVTTDTIGCEALCPTCEKCAPLEWALVFRKSEEDVGLDHKATIINGLEDVAYAMIIDPTKLAELLVRGAKARGLNAYAHAHWDWEPDDDVEEWVVLSVDAHGIWVEHEYVGDGDSGRITMPMARAALKELMASKLDCGSKVVTSILWRQRRS